MFRNFGIVLAVTINTDALIVVAGIVALVALAFRYWKRCERSENTANTRFALEQMKDFKNVTFTSGVDSFSLSGERQKPRAKA
jgi:hypothetical protein